MGVGAGAGAEFWKSKAPKSTTLDYKTKLVKNRKE